MPMSNYPNGFANGLSVRNMPVLNTYGGKVFWVDSNTGNAGNNGSLDKPVDYIKQVFDRGLVTANNGDIVICKSGHVEPVSSAGYLDLDVAGVTIIFLGDGTDRAYINFTTATSADMDIDAANITLINPKFVAGIDALTGPIDVNATDFTIINGEYHDAEDIETKDCIIATSGATRLTIDGYKFFKANEGGTQKLSHIQCDGVDDLTLKNIHIEGDFDTGIFETGSDECLRMTLQNIFMKNTDPGNAPCLEMDSANSGWADNVHLRNANGTAVSNVADLNWSDRCFQYSTDGATGNAIGTGSGDTSTIASDLVVTQSDVKVVVSDLAIVASDIVILDTVADSIYSDTAIILSDLKALRTAWDAFETIMSDFVVQYQSDNA